MFETFIEKLQSNRFLSLETTPGHTASSKELIQSIQELSLHQKVDAFTTTDSPLSKLKQSSLFAAIKIQQALQKPVIATMSMRDKNSIALQSDLLGANEFDIKTILALTGDSAKMSDQPNPKAVVEGDATLLLKIIAKLNSGVDLADKPLKVAPNHIYGLAVSPSDISKKQQLLKKMVKKLQAGAIAIITQPLFDKNHIEPLLEIFEEAKKQSGCEGELIIGSFPIVKFKTANFLHNKVPGANIPQRWLEILEHSKDEYQDGFALSHEVYEGIKTKHGKCHLMAANNFTLANALIEA
ncbi:MAG: methylenetetrahydrofolate reductase [Campylobacterota bacterium]